MISVHNLGMVFVTAFALTMVGNSLLLGSSHTYAQTLSNNTSIQGTNGANQFIVNIRGITMFTEKNMIALISTDNDVQAKRVDLTKVEIEPGQADSYSPRKMVDVTIAMDKPVKPKSEVTACVIQLGSTDFTQSIKCNVVFSEQTTPGEPQKIIVPL